MLTAVTPRSPRPVSPSEQDRNPLLKNIDANSGIVKYQVITRGESEEIVVGRLKIPTPEDGHAFILRRFDTGAISVSTMIRAAFPKFPEELEKKETTWVRTAFDCAGANGQGARRLAGIWAPLPVALHLADFYRLSEIITPLVNAIPDPKNVPRRSTRSSAAAAENNNISSLSPPSPGKTKTPPAKRRRAETPKSPTAPNASLPALSQDTHLPVSTRTGRDSASPARVTRSSASPARQVPVRRSIRSPKPSTATIREVDDHEQDPEDVMIGGPDPTEDIEKSKALVATIMKAAQDAAPTRVFASPTAKRTHEPDIKIPLNIRGPPAKELVVARPIATNRRITMTPARKAAAWGALAFSIGLGAVAFLPSFL